MSRIYRSLIQEPLRDLARRPKGQIPALDALRVCAIMLVLCGHVCALYTEIAGRGNGFTKLPFVTGGWMGVDLFFVLSGYFIGRQLWRELQETGTIRMGRFALRRGLRIWPLYFFFLVLVVAVLGRGDFPGGQWWSDAVFLTNYLNWGVVGGSWSLCTEEQFYLVTPLLLVFGLGRIGSVAGYRPYLVGLLLLEPAVRAASWWCLTGTLAHHNLELYNTAIYQPIHTHADGLIMGLLIANLELTGGDRCRRGLLSSGWAVLAALAACLVLKSVQPGIFNFSGLALVFGAVVWSLLCQRRSWLAVLDAIPFYWVSRLSFGMYLNHAYIMNPVVAFSLEAVPLADRFPEMHTIITVGIVAALSAAAALVTFCLVEHPFLYLRHALLDRARTRRLQAPAPVPAPGLVAVAVPTSGGSD